MRRHTSMEGRNLTNVWNIPMGQTKKSHYAVFSSALIERPVAMTCPLEITAQGPKRRIVEMVPYEEARPFSRGIGKYTKPEEEIRVKSGRQDTGRKYIPRKPVTVGWEPDLPAIRRGIVLDPFCGTATSGEVALKLGRHFIGIELYEENAQIAEERCHQAQLLRTEYEAKRFVGNQSSRDRTCANSAQREPGSATWFKRFLSQQPQVNESNALRIPSLGGQEGKGSAPVGATSVVHDRMPIILH
jgi:hypothetical protein